MIPLIKQGIEEKSEAQRRAVGVVLSRILIEWDRETIGRKGIAELEGAVRKMATEKDAEVRRTGKGMWKVYVEKWPERVDE